MIPPQLYLVTDRTRTRGRPLLDVVEAALDGGVDAVQLREKDMSGKALYQLALELRRVCQRHGARFLINDRIDVALAVDADGVHLPTASFSPTDARRLVGAGKIIGASTHSLAEARAAEAAGADFIVFGPIFDTPSKRGYGAPIGIEPLQAVTHGLRRPVLAIGGATIERVELLRQAGAAGVAVVAGILEAENPTTAAEQYKALLNAAQRELP